MAQEGYDKLMALTDSRYRLSMIVARRAAQLKSGVPSLLQPGELAPTENTVTVAMKELELRKDVHWGDNLPSIEDLRRVTASLRQEQQETSLPQEPAGMGAAAAD